MPIRNYITRREARFGMPQTSRCSLRNKRRARLTSVPVGMWSVIAAAAITAVGFLLVGPIHQPSKFYEIAAGIMPAFLVAVAVERSLLGTLGTKADFARVRRDETVDSYSPRGFDGGVLHTIELALLDRTDGVNVNDAGMRGIPVEPIDIAKTAVVGNWDDDPMFWSVFRDQLHDEFGLQAEDPSYFDPPGEFIDSSTAFRAMRESVLRREAGPAIRMLAAHAALRADREFREGIIGNQLVKSELKRLHDAHHEIVLRRVLNQVTYLANREYGKRVHQLVLSLRTSIVLLTSTEFLALIGVLSPGHPYAGLFVVTAAAVAASITNVSGGALADLAHSQTHS